MMSKTTKLMLFVTFFSNYAFSATIESSSGGGIWENSTTWIGNVVPDENDDVIINGTVSMTKSNSCNSITVSQGAIFQNGGDEFSWVILTVNGKIINNGTIRDNPEGYRLWLSLAGDIENNGIWTPEYTHLVSETVQNITQNHSVEFGGSFQKHSSETTAASSFALVAQSDLILNMNQFDGQGSKDGEYFWGTLDMNNHNLTIKGKTELTRSILKNVTKLTGQDSSSLKNISAENEIELDGCITVTNSDVTFNGDVIITGILQNGGNDLSWVTPKFKGNLVNNGIIRNNPDNYELWLDLYGDVVNNGIWKVTRTGFVSLQPQTISQTEGKEFCGTIYKSSTGSKLASDTCPLIAASDITVNGENFDCTGSMDGEYFNGTIDMQSHNMTLKGKTVFFNAILENVDTFYCYDSVIIKTITFNGPVTLGGEVTINDANVHFNDQVTVSGILQNGPDLGWVTLNINNDIINNGTIRNNPDGYRLWTNIQGNVENNGIWVNQKNTLIGHNNQTITLPDNKTIASQFIFDAHWSDGPYQWKKNNQEVGETGKLLTIDSITPDMFGTYQCVKEDSLSRLIVIAGDGTHIQKFSKNPGMALVRNLKWNIVSGKQLFINVYTPKNCSYSIDIYNIVGKKQLNRSGILTKGDHTIPLIKTVPGTYLFRFQSDDITNVRKFTVTR